MVDCRFLPNPHWEQDLRPLTGRDPAVAEFVLGQPAAEPFLRSYVPALNVVFQGYAEENKRYVTIAVGCTGGKHRSVAMAEELARRITASGDAWHQGEGAQTSSADDSTGVSVRVVHRDLGRE